MSENNFSFHLKMAVLYLLEARNSFLFISLIYLSSLILLSTSFLIKNNIKSFIDQRKEKYEIILYLKDGADKNKLLASINEYPNIAQIIYVNQDIIKEQIQKEDKKLSELINTLTFNPYPNIYKITLRKEVWSKDVVKDLVDFLVKRDEVDEVDFGKNWIDFLSDSFIYLEVISNYIFNIFLAVGLMLMFIVTVNTSKHFKLHIERLKLMGASRGFIRMPFILIGVFVGVLSSIVAISLLYSIFSLVAKDLSLSFLTLQQALIIIGLGFIIPVFGNLFSIK